MVNADKPNKTNFRCNSQSEIKKKKIQTSSSVQEETPINFLKMGKALRCTRCSVQNTEPIENSISLSGKIEGAMKLIIQFSEFLLSTNYVNLFSIICLFADCRHSEKSYISRGFNHGRLSLLRQHESFGLYSF